MSDDQSSQQSLAAAQSSQSKPSMSPQDPDVLAILRVAAPPWMKDGLGIMGQQDPRQDAYGEFPSIYRKPSPQPVQPVSIPITQVGADIVPSAPPSSGGASFPFWDWTGDEDNGFNLWFGTPITRHPDSNGHLQPLPAEVHSVSFFSHEHSGIIHTTVDDKVEMYGYQGKSDSGQKSDGAPDLGNGGNNFVLKSDTNGSLLNLDTTQQASGYFSADTNGSKIYGQKGGTGSSVKEDGTLDKGNSGNNYLIQADTHGSILNLATANLSSGYFTANETSSLLYGQHGGISSSVNDDGSLNAGNSGNNYQLKADNQGASLNVASTTGNGALVSQEKLLVYGANGSFAALYKTGSLQLHDGPTNNDLLLYPYELQLKDGNGYTGTYEAKQLTLSASNGDETYLSTSALHIGSQQGNAVYEPIQLTLTSQNGQSYLSTAALHITGQAGGNDGTYEPHQITLRNGSKDGVDANAAEIKTFKASGSYAAIGSDGTLSLKDSQGKQLDLNAQDLQFDSDTEHGYFGSDKVSIWDNSNTATLDSNSLVITDTANAQATVEITQSGITIGDTSPSNLGTGGNNTTTISDRSVEVEDTNADFRVTVEASSITVEDIGEGKSATLDVPTDGDGNKANASWQEIEICSGSETKKMKVFGTAPY